MNIYNLYKKEDFKNYKRLEMFLVLEVKQLTKQKHFPIQKNKAPNQPLRLLWSLDETKDEIFASQSWCSIQPREEALKLKLYGPLLFYLY